MSANRFVAAILLYVSFALAGQAAAQDSMPKPSFGDGVFEQVAPKIEKLLRLKLTDDNLVLSTDWEDRLKQEKKNKVVDERQRAEMIKEFVARGLPKLEAEEISEKLLKHDINPFDRRLHFRAGKQPAVQKAFLAVASNLGSRSSSRSNNKSTFSTSQLSGESIATADNSQFKFVEAQGDERSFEMSSNEGKLKFEFSFDQLFVRFSQTKRGKTKLTWIAGDKVDVYLGDSFSDFAKRNPEPTEKLLLPLFKRLGIAVPTKTERASIE